jgi:hypothetical protein
MTPRPTRRLAVAVAAAVATLAASGAASAQTVQQVADQGACSTSGVTKLSEQLVAVQMCLSPGTFVPFTPHAGVTLTSTKIHAYLLATARDALWAAAAKQPVQVNSAFRTLADQFVLYYSSACGLAATPGNSNHETGRAVDLENWSAALSAMTAAGCTHPYPGTDDVHFDCPGADHRSDSILAFQKLWNLNNPGDLLVEDGDYGPQTEARLAKSPSTGFAKVPTCEPGADAGPTDAGPSDAGATDTGVTPGDGAVDGEVPDAAFDDAGADAIVSDGGDRLDGIGTEGCACRAGSTSTAAGGSWPSALALLGVALGLVRVATRR